MDKEYTTIELYIIEKVKKMREEQKMSPNKLSLEMGLARGVIGKIERFEKGSKYNMNQLNEIAKVLKCKITDFFPDPYIEENCLEEYAIIREARKKQSKKSKKK